jgi:Domain of unknown function (DUF1830)
MTAVLSQRFESSQPLYYYSNRSGQLQVAVVSNLPGFHLEQVVFPGQRWMFCCPAAAVLEIYCADAGVPTCQEQIPCSQLQVIEPAAVEAADPR